MASHMVPEGVNSDSGGALEFKDATWKRNPLFVTQSVKEADRFPITRWRPRNGRDANFIKWEFNIEQLLEAMGDPDFLSRPVPSIATPIHATKLAEQQMACGRWYWAGL